MTITPDPAETAAHLRRVLDAVEAGEIEATATEVERMTGAVVALRAVAGESRT